MAKPGRNDPCPCGSGKKYKKCCLTNDEAAENERLVAERAEREERAAAKRQELRKVREAITANFAASDLLDDDFGDELMDASNSVVDLIRAGKLDEAEAAARDLLVATPIRMTAGIGSAWFTRRAARTSKPPNATAN